MKQQIKHGQQAYQRTKKKKSKQNNTGAIGTNSAYSYNIYTKG
jgi:hypothetical protein